MIDNAIFFKLTHYSVWYAFKYCNSGITVSYLLQIVPIQTFTSIFLYYPLPFLFFVSTASAFFHLYRNHQPHLLLKRAIRLTALLLLLLSELLNKVYACLKMKKKAIALHSSLSLGHLCFVSGELHFNTLKIHGAHSLLWCFAFIGLLSVLWPFRRPLLPLEGQPSLGFTYT